MCSRICDNISKNEKILFGSGYDEAPESEESSGASASALAGKRRRGDRWLHDLVEVMLYQEIYKRRSDRRRRRRKFY